MILPARNKTAVLSIQRFYIVNIYRKIAVIMTALLIVACVNDTSFSQSLDVMKVHLANDFIDPSHVVVKGELGRAISISEHGRLRSLPTWNDSALIKMFTEEAKVNNKKQDWYGEHAGKWLYATTLAVKRTNNEDLKRLLFNTANYLIATQEKDGYLGSYSKELRLTNKNNKIKNRSWDVWSLSYMSIGLLKLNEYFPDKKYLDAAKKIGALFLKTFSDGSAVVTDYGTRDGISATIILDAIVELYKSTGDQQYLRLAKLVVKEMEEKEGVHFISVGLHNGDMESIGDGKAYQIIWNLTALVKLYEVTGNTTILTAMETCWKNIVDYHLTIAGGPWGGIGKHYECFNKKGFWDPYGFIETCSTMSWIQFNKELLKISGKAKYAEEIEKSAYNALQGAQFPNGEDWSYHSFSNGRRHVAHFNDCCPSSGALALEELTPMIYSVKENGISCNLYTESEGNIVLPGANNVKILQNTAYPFAGKIKLTLYPSRESTFPVFIRIPAWANSTTISVNGNVLAADDLKSGTFYKIEHNWKKNDVVDISFPFELKIREKSENATVPQGTADIYNINWFALSKGPLVYAANGLIDGVDREGVYRFSLKNSANLFKETKAPDGMEGSAYQLSLPGKSPLLFVPYYEAGGRIPGSWRLTWVEKEIDN